MWWMNFAEQTPPPSPGSDKPPRQQAPAEAEDADAEGEEEGDEDEVQEEVSRTLVAMVPWTVSLLLHAALVMLAIWIVYSEIIREEPDREIQPVPQLSPDPGTPQVTDRPQEQQETARQRTLTPDDAQTDAQVDSPVPTQDTSIAIQGGADAAANPFDGDVGDTDAPFAGSEFYGTELGNVRRVAFLVDASGSLTDTLPFVINEINSTLRDFVSEQHFSIIFFQTAANRGFVEVPDANGARGRMHQATDSNKAHAQQWMAPRAHNVIPQGQQNPRETLIPALQHALRMNPRPELVILLSDNILGQGRYEIDRQTLLRSVLDVIPRERVKVNTFQFLREEHLSGTPTLRTIAEQTGGIYTFVPASDLNIAAH